jgi:hypothetical protein
VMPLAVGIAVILRPLKNSAAGLKASGHHASRYWQVETTLRRSACASENSFKLVVWGLLQIPVPAPTTSQIGNRSQTTARTHDF